MELQFLDLLERRIFVDLTSSYFDYQRNAQMNNIAYIPEYLSNYFRCSSFIGNQIGEYSGILKIKHCLLLLLFFFTKYSFKL